MLGLNLRRGKGLLLAYHDTVCSILQSFKRLRSFLLFSTLCLFSTLVSAGQITAKLTFATSNNPVTDVVVTAYQIKPDGGLLWYTRQTTDQSGEAVFELAELGTGHEYVLQATVYNNFRVSSAVISAAGTVAMPFGTTRISVRDGTDVNFPLIGNKKVFIYQLSDTDVKTYFTTVYSDDTGRLKIDLPNLDNGQRYLLAAQSTLSGLIYYSQPLTNSGEHQFAVGDRPLRVTLIDGVTGAPIDAKQIDVYKFDDQGNSQWFARAHSDLAGQVSFDLSDLPTGTTYQLKSKVFNDRYAVSPVLTGNDPYEFKVGSVVVHMQNGTDSSMTPLANTMLTVTRKSADTYLWHDAVISDENGRVRLDLPDLTKGAVYRFNAASPINGSMKYSNDLLAPGTMNFVVGSPVITVTLSNLVTGMIYPNEEVNAYTVDAMGEFHWYSRNNTDPTGKAIFDLDKINQGQAYIFKVNKFTTGVSYSSVLESAQDMNFAIGAVPLSLIDKATDQGLANIEVTAYQVLADGQLIWEKSAKTDSSGQLIFDFVGLAKGQRFVFKATNPFGQSQSYYGPVVTTGGQVNFYLKQGEFEGLDLVAPTISFDKPNKSIAYDQGFDVAGDVADNQAVEHIDVVVVDPVHGQHTIKATFDEVNRRWHATIQGAWISAGNAVTVTATAVDYSNNQASISRNYTITEDTTPPVIAFTSHQADEFVNAAGFTLLGTVIDDVEVVSIVATVNDPILGETVSGQSLNVSSHDGQWALPVLDGKVSLNQTVTFTLVATDISGKNTQATLTLKTQAVSTTPVYLAQRITFGVTPQLLASIKLGDDILTEQLNPDSIDDAQFEADMAAMPVNSRSDLQQYLLKYMTGSKKQLREVMAWFWENHFSTNINVHGYPAYELAENNLFRQHALGNFRTLLDVSAKSAAMIRYLSNSQNVVGGANENYAREVMELHTIGIDGGYTATDIAELALMFTGWHEKDGQFTFNESLHDNRDKTFLGQTIVGGNAQEGDQALDILASHPKTADFICSKLITLFVSEQPSSLLQTECAATFMSTQGEIVEVLKVLFNSPQFISGQDYRSKVKTPLELLLSTVRGFDATITPEQMSEQLSSMGMSLFEFSIPTGYSEVGEDWLNSNAIVQRIRLVNQMARDHIDFKQLLLAKGVSSAQAVVSHLFEMALFNEFTELEFNLAVAILNAKQPFDIDSADADEKLNRLLGTVLSFPSFQYQ